MTKKFCDYLAKNINLLKKFNFEVIISIGEESKIKYILLNIKNKKNKTIKQKKENVNVYIEIEREKKRNIIKKK